LVLVGEKIRDEVADLINRPVFNVLQYFICFEDNATMCYPASCRVLSAWLVAMSGSLRAVDSATVKALTVLGRKNCRRS